MSQAHVELDPPPPLPEGALRVIPMGGLGAIGRNMTVLEFDGKLLVIDCGVLFPDVEQPGVDLILPDFTPILDRLDDIQAIVLTHGHEDHIGAVPYLLAHKADIPLVGSEFTLALVEAKLAERRLDPYTLTVREGQTERLGPFDCEFFAVNHSIPDALAVAVRTPAGLVLHTGDFKMDQVPLDGRITDLAGFARLGAEGVDLLLSDSTNAEVPGFVAPERDIGPVLSSIFGKARGRIIVASFASHVHRVQQVMDAAWEFDRKVALIGRSMVRNMGIARDLGLLNIPDGLLVNLDEATNMPADEIVFMSTGSQGEPMSALGRMATGDHRHITIEPGDTVVLASSLVPGNETSVYRVINRLSRAGATVVHKETAKVHVSGHAPAGELLYLLNVVRPSNLLPVHGEWRHLRAHAQLGIESGVAADRVVLCEDGDVVDLVEGHARHVGRVQNRYVYVDGLAVGDVSESLLTERRILGDGGFISATVVIDSVTGKVVGEPNISAKGFSEDPDAFSPVIPLLTAALHRSAEDGITDTHQLQQVVRRTVGRWVNDAYRRRPMIVPTVVEV
ncbi:ribonuclease J [Paractinoplanes brasiliensis]|uniref:Ribonuclease J n=1 Tax=Paractinoplanes brasiliensis TaxID=52695 RepID=A0A4R6JVL7_9ACTN|nr:ribonuclease J [Actinoplanes brasiliensis]MDY7086527.1 ribonuclease J [Actinomycetota bacterium]TDO40780.1 ribonuclease J [Actinoplanes brasiliensis]GID25849.1 ribonuclease J [Actinoplanes brasiliensis]